MGIDSWVARFEKLFQRNLEFHYSDPIVAYAQAPLSNVTPLQYPRVDMFKTTPDKFADWFNETYPSAYHPITAEDARGMTTCGLICRYRCISISQDGKTVRAVLQWETTT